MDIDPSNGDCNFTLRERGSHLESAIALRRKNAPRPVDCGSSHLGEHAINQSVSGDSPAFDWQMTNLRNYVNFSLTDLPPV